MRGRFASSWVLTGLAVSILTAHTLTIAAQTAQPTTGTTGGDAALPNKKGSVKFAVIGDTGTGSSSQQRVAERLTQSRGRFPFEFVLMLGDNLYGGENPDDFVRKFERPYKALLDAGVTFHATLGNHDDPKQVFYKPFNMNGERYYSFKAPSGSIRFFSLNSNYMDKPQLAWLEKELSASGSEWKIAFFHHPLYSSGDKHGADEVLREQLEPLFLKYGVDLVLTGHEHFYERLKPQKGIQYFIAGSSAKLRKGNIGSSSGITAKGFDTGYAFLLMEIIGDELYFQTVTDEGKIIDSGRFTRRAVDKSS
jgi:3',5'-cyclic AMP phosphodiesterase CpdA